MLLDIRVQVHGIPYCVRGLARGGPRQGTIEVEQWGGVGGETVGSSMSIVISQCKYRGTRSEIARKRGGGAMVMKIFYEVTKKNSSKKRGERQVTTVMEGSGVSRKGLKAMKGGGRGRMEVRVC